MAEADIWPDGGIFAEDDEEGVFADDEDVFGEDYEEEDEADEADEAEEDVRPARRSPHDNPLVTRAQEDMVSALPGTPAPAAKRQMVAVFGADGKPLVAYAVNGQVQGQFRAPSAAEIRLLQTQGRFMERPQPAALPSASLFPGRAGMGEAVAAPEPPPPAKNFLQRNATLLAALTAVGVGAGVYYWQKRKQARQEENTTDLELDADDAAEQKEEA